MEKYWNHVIDLKYLGRNKIIVFLNSYTKANLFVEDKKLEKLGYKVYVPRHLCCVTGVLAGIPTDIDIREIKAEIECDCQVVDVYRFNRFRNGIKEPTTRVSVTFRANQLPEMVKLFCCTNKVRPFLQKVLFCENCHRFNHETDNCKGKQRCSRCSQIYDEKDEICTNPVKCLYCKSSDHKTTDVTCPERQKQKTIKTIIAKRSLTLVEARELVAPVLTSNVYEALAESATDPTPAESFAFMAANKHIKKPIQVTGTIPKCKIEIRERNGNGRVQTEQSYSRRNLGLITEKRSKINESRSKQDQAEMDNTEQANGWFNPHKVSDAER
ncbi:uncharacterized protein LOC129716976 [Wyeomyia smithii]|uniref:uncharacterized protein LOC129716976 n=1 Tax=Wyeomyia smithii TaxID=174621 RepID=UPI002467CFFA|nr:uncharacterized protein LOC129716976 [Wyeomyia smithii]